MWTRWSKCIRAAITVATRDQLARALVNAHEAGDTEAAKTLAAELKRTSGDTDWQPTKPDSLAKRAGMGALETGLGVAQLASRPVGMVYPRSPEAVDATVSELQARQEAGAPEGFDAARMVGNVGPLLPVSFARVPALLSGAISSGRPMVQGAKAGALAGAGGGAVTPTSGEDFALNKTAQIGIGALGGALLGPAASKGGQLVGRGVNAARAALGRPNQNISFHLDQILQSQGINPQAIGRDLRRDLEAQVAQAMETGGQVDAAALANLATLEAVGARQHATRGMVSQQPVQFGEELSLREASPELAARFQGVRNQLGGRLQEMQGATATTTPGAGRAALSVLKNADESARLQTRQLYEAAEQAQGNTVFIRSREPFQRAMAELKQRRAIQDLDPGARAILNDLQSGKLTVRQAVEDIESLNARLEPGSKASIGINIVKRHIDDAIDDAATEAGGAFKLARQRHRARKLEQEQLPALRAVSEARTPDELARLSDDFMGRHVYGGSVSDVRRMMDFLRQRDPNAANAIRGRVVADLREAATKNEQGKFLQNAFNTKLRELEDSELLGVFFNAQEQQMLRNVGRAGQLLEGPPGVSRTGMGGMARAINMLGQVAAKYGGNWLGAPIGAGANRISHTIRAQNALAAPAVASTGNLVPRYRNALAAGSGAGIIPFFDE